MISDFKNSKEEEQLIIPEWLFDQRMKVLFKLYCPINEGDVKPFIDKIESFTNGKLNFVLWSTRNIKSLFPLKDRVKHLCYVIYKGECSCGRRYIGETIRNMRAQQVNQDVAKDLADSKSRMFMWKVLASAPLHFHIRKILEAFFITKLKLDLNDRIEHHGLSLFQHGFT